MAAESVEIIKACSEALNLVRAYDCKIDLTIEGRWGRGDIHVLIEPLGIGMVRSGGQVPFDRKKPELSSVTEGSPPGDPGRDKEVPPS